MKMKTKTFYEPVVVSPPPTSQRTESTLCWSHLPPHTSHMGGSWEHLIEVARRILDAMLSWTEQTRLTHEVLGTLMAEVMAIINARPLIPPESPAVLTPAMSLTQKMSAISAPSGDFSSGQLFGKKGGMFNTLLAPFGKGGMENICPPYKVVQSGLKPDLMSGKEM